MIEKEARTKWCPMARQALTYRTDYYGTDHSSSPSGNKFHTGKLPTGSLCIASDCMMWRWERNKDYGGYFNKGFCGFGEKP